VAFSLFYKMSSSWSRSLLLIILIVLAAALTMWEAFSLVDNWGTGEASPRTSYSEPPVVYHDYKGNSGENPNTEPPPPPPPLNSLVEREKVYAQRRRHIADVCRKYNNTARNRHEREHMSLQVILACGVVRNLNIKLQIGVM
jgi:hypothetical protein